MEKHVIKINENFVLEIDDSVEVIIDLKNNNVTVRSKDIGSKPSYLSSPPFLPHKEDSKPNKRRDDYAWMINPGTVWSSSTTGELYVREQK
jgi:hypothetical protein